MATAELTLDSQVVHKYNGAEGNGIATTGTIRSGDYEVGSFGIAASTALLFELPQSFSGDETIVSAILNLRASTGVPQTSAGYGDHRSRIRILASSTQELPTTGSAILSLSGGSEEKTIGEGTYSPVLDHVVTSSYSDETIDITDMMQQAVNASRLVSGWMVVLIQPVDYDEANYLDANGIGQTSPPTIDIEYTEGSPALDGDLVFDRTIDDIIVICEISNGAFIDSNVSVGDISITCEATVPERSFDFELIIGDIGLESTVESANNVEASIQIGDVGLTATAVILADIDSSITIGGIGLTANAIVDDFRQLDVVLTVGDVQLTSESATGLSILADIQIGDVQIVSATIAGSRRSRDLFPNGLQSRSYHRLMY